MLWYLIIICLSLLHPEGRAYLFKKVSDLDRAHQSQSLVRMLVLLRPLFKGQSEMLPAKRNL